MVESLGDQGDGIAKVERGYVVIVSDAHPSDELTVRIDRTQENIAFASVVDRDDRTLGLPFVLQSPNTQATSDESPR